MNRAMGDILHEQVKGRVRENEPMEHHTSFRIGGPADLFVEPRDLDDLIIALEICTEHQIPVMIVGAGTNMLVRDGGIRGAVIGLREMKRVERRGASSVYADCGALLSGLVMKSVSWELSDLEFAVGIPGSVGGAVIMNAGAHGSSISNVVKRVEMVSPDGSVNIIDVYDLSFSYRRCHIDEGKIVTGVEFTLQPGDSVDIKKRIEKHLSWRKDNQPLKYPSAGSVFKNPPDVSAGKVIDDLGMKGMNVGGAKVSETHANFIVNTGGAVARDVLELIDRIRERVNDRHGIELELEIRVVGEDE
ncbi:MAG: UDP-N-acetylmuramate dehydrogenase [Deltaproteobacteria bacterium]|nr:UDP-N-acetylmuramate dehydrogenase [Candidatus Zymogenaceae bacterium]